MNLTELAQLYGVCTKTLKKWLRPYQNEIGEKNHTNIYTTAQVIIIFQKIGEP